MRKGARQDLEFFLKRLDKKLDDFYGEMYGIVEDNLFDADAERLNAYRKIENSIIVQGTHTHKRFITAVQKVLDFYETSDDFE